MAVKPDRIDAMVEVSDYERLRRRQLLEEEGDSTVLDFTLYPDPSDPDASTKPSTLVNSLDLRKLEMQADLPTLDINSSIVGFDIVLNPPTFKADFGTSNTPSSITLKGAL